MIEITTDDASIRFQRCSEQLLERLSDPNEQQLTTAWLRTVQSAVRSPRDAALPACLHDWLCETAFGAATPHAPADVDVLSSPNAKNGARAGLPSKLISTS